MGRRLGTLILVAALVAVGVFAGSALSQWWEVPGTGAAAEAVGGRVRPRERIRVEVLSGGGRSGLARDATEALRGDGFDVVYFGNARASGGDSSVVLDRVGRPDLARSVADALGIRNVRSEPDSNLYLDVSVVLGAGWDLPPAAEAAAGEETDEWWDVRRFLPREDSTPAPPPPAPGAKMADPTGGDR